MPHISKRHVDNNQFNKIYNELIEIFGIASKKSKSKFVFAEFFTKTEKIMFAKRFAVIVMLTKKFSNYEIANQLGMSPATIDRMSLKFEKGDYSNLTDLISNSKNIIEKLELIFLTVGGMMPPIVGRSRVRELKKKYS